MIRGSEQRRGKLRDAFEFSKQDTLKDSIADIADKAGLSKKIVLEAKEYAYGSTPQMPTSIRVGRRYFHLVGALRG